MIIVTGGAGFIGSNLIRALNERGERNIVLVDDLKNGHKMHNIADLDIADYLAKDDFIGHIRAMNFPGNVRAVFHQGACSATTEWDGRYVMANNYDYSKELLHICRIDRIPFIYASSASVYGDGKNGFRVDRSCEQPINMYAYSKFQFDQYVRRILPFASSQIVGFRYFNVYGPRMLRYKGVLFMKGSDRKVIFQGVHQLMGSDLGPKWAPGEKKISKMVFIGIDLPKDILMQGLEGCLA